MYKDKSKEKINLIKHNKYKPKDKSKITQSIIAKMPALPLSPINKLMA
jgi:hypothetical protein